MMVRHLGPKGVALTLALMMSGCRAPAEPDLVGTWGGAEVSLVLARDGGSLTYQCGTGTIGTGWRLTGDEFEGSGSHFFGGGPVPSGGREPHPATYRGQLHGDRLTLTVHVIDLDITLGPFTLERGGPVVVELCV